MSVLVDKGKAIHFLDCSITSNTASQCIFAAKPGCHGLHRGIIRWVKKLLESQLLVLSSKLIHWRAGWLLWVTQTGWVMSWEEAQSSTISSEESCSWDGTAPHDRTGCTHQLEGTMTKRTWQPWWITSQAERNKEPAFTLTMQVCVGKCTASRSREVDFLLYLSFVKPYVKCYTNFGVLSAQKIPKHSVASWKATKMLHMVLKRRWENWNSSGWINGWSQQKLKWDLTSKVYKVKGQESTDKIEENLFCRKEIVRTGKGADCQVELQNLRLWKFSKFNCTRTWTIWYNIKIGVTLSRELDQLAFRDPS